MSCFSPFLKIGVTFAFFRSSGKMPLVILRFNIVAKGWDTTDADNFKYFALMSSIPVALFVFRFCNYCCMNEAET